RLCGRHWIVNPECIASPQKFRIHRLTILWRTFFGPKADASEPFYGNAIGTVQSRRRNCRKKSLILYMIKSWRFVAVALRATRALRTRLRSVTAGRGGERAQLRLF